jgi:hypothetical protein
MPPKSAIRASGKPKPKPKMTPADRVRLEWAGFEAWLAVQRKEVEVGSLHYMFPGNAVYLFK